MRKEWLAPVAAALVFLCGWEAAVRFSLLDALFFPPPSTLFMTFAAMLRHGEIGRNLRLTLTRTAAGFAAGAVARIGAGAAMGASPWIRRTLEPLVAGVNSTPKLTLLPMVMLLAGSGEPAWQILLAASAFVIVTMNTLDGVRSLNPHFREMAVNFGASRGMLFRRIYLPAGSPHIFTGLRVALGRTLVLAITMEMLGGSGGGLGYLVWHSWQMFAIERLYVAVILAALLGVCIHRGLILTESRLIPWKAR